MSLAEKIWSDAKENKIQSDEITFALISQLRDLASKLESGDAFLQSFSSQSPRSAYFGLPMRLVMPTVGIRSEDQNGIREYAVIIPVVT